MRICFTKTKGMVFLALIGSLISVSNPLLAAPKKLQWRSTVCQIEQEGKDTLYIDCNAGFTHGGRLLAVKMFDEQTREPTYYQVGTNGAYSSGTLECISVQFHPDHGGVIQSYCTYKTPWELGISGAPRAFTPQPAQNNPAPPFVRDTSGDLRFKTMVRCGRAFPGYNFVNHPDKQGHKACMKMAGYD